ncbi:ABC transporter ATP-binding protein [Myroides sp. DW712]|uniref:ABC transporter ATP-binding protein n=1 Tax=Myroides sp. DW712 TaxID=3389800 RepID=UPI00397E3F27
MKDVVIAIQNVYKQYKGADFFSIEAVSLQINRGDFIGVLGPNGAGKTTLLSMLYGLIKPTSGVLEIEGMTYQQNPIEIKSKIGVVPQEYALYPTLSAHENLMFLGSMYGLKGKELKQKIQYYLAYLGLEAFAHKKIDTFSGGMKRRVNLIAGILHDPAILFLDEPTVGVDLQSRLLIVDFLKELSAKGTTIVYTSHHLHEVQELCTSIAIINKGQLFGLGTSEDLMMQTKTANLEEAFLQLTGINLKDNV